MPDVTQGELDHWRLFTERMRLVMFALRLHVSTGDKGKATQLVNQTISACARVGLKMEQAGAGRPKTLPEPPELTREQLGTPAARRYAIAIKRAMEAAQEVDTERGYGDAGTASVLAPLVRLADAEAWDVGTVAH